MENLQIKDESKHISYAEEFLDKLNLNQYLKIFIENGFENEESILNITEKNLTDWNVKMGHSFKILDQIKRIKYEIEYCKNVDSILFHFLILGAGGAGKTSLSEYYRTHECAENYLPTQTPKGSHHAIVFRNKKVVINLIDTGGQDAAFDFVQPKMFQNAIGVLGVCSIDNEKSMGILEQRLTKLREFNCQSTIVIACNKYDLKDKYSENFELISEEFKNFNKRNSNEYKFYYVSAHLKPRHNVSKVFSELIHNGISNFIFNKFVNSKSNELNIRRCIEISSSQTCKTVAINIQYQEYENENKNDDNNEGKKNENNSICKFFYGIGYYENKNSDWIKEHNIYYCYFEGNDYFSDSFSRLCQTLWQQRPSNIDDDKIKAVTYMYESLRKSNNKFKWKPVVFAIDINKKNAWRAKFKQKWTAKTGTMEITALC